MVRVSFAPSHSLDDALHRFLLPKYENRQILLYSERHVRLPYDWSDTGGPRYDRHDAQRLANQELQLRDMGQQPIRLRQLEMLESTRGDWRVRFELDPTIHQRRQLGGFVLGDLIENIQAQVWVYASIHHAAAAPASQVKEEAARLNQLLTPLSPPRHEEGGDHVTRVRRARAFDDIAGRFFVVQPRLIERTGDLRAVRDGA